MTGPLCDEAQCVASSHLLAHLVNRACAFSCPPLSRDYCIRSNPKSASHKPPHAKGQTLKCSHFLGGVAARCARSSRVFGRLSRDHPLERPSQKRTRTPDTHHRKCLEITSSCTEPQKQQQSRGRLDGVGAAPLSIRPPPPPAQSVAPHFLHRGLSTLRTVPQCPVVPRSPRRGGRAERSLPDEGVPRECTIPPAHSPPPPPQRKVTAPKSPPGTPPLSQNRLEYSA